MYAITNGHSYAEAGKLASLASSKVVEQFGPRLTTPQVEKVLEHLLL
jgi:sugar/nucleoside kinase (ribokinase family)